MAYYNLLTNPIKWDKVNGYKCSKKHIKRITINEREEKKVN